MHSTSANIRSPKHEPDPKKKQQTKRWMVRILLGISLKEELRNSSGASDVIAKVTPPKLNCTRKITEWRTRDLAFRK